jgi:hypothetical protein
MEGVPSNSLLKAFAETSMSRKVGNDVRRKTESMAAGVT